MWRFLMWPYFEKKFEVFHTIQLSDYDMVRNCYLNYAVQLKRQQNKARLAYHPSFMSTSAFFTHTHCMNMKEVTGT